jgi:hypothetical protein
MEFYEPKANGSAYFMMGSGLGKTNHIDHYETSKNPMFPDLLNDEAFHFVA